MAEFVEKCAPLIEIDEEDFGENDGDIGVSKHPSGSLKNKSFSSLDIDYEDVWNRKILAADVFIQRCDGNFNLLDCGGAALEIPPALRRSRHE